MKFLSTLLFLLALVVAGLYFGSRTWLTRTTAEKLPVIESAAKEYGVNLEKLQVSSSSFAMPAALQWKNISGVFTLDGFSGIKSDRPFRFSIDKALIGVTDFGSKRFFGQLQGLELKTGDAGAEAHTEKNTYVSSELQSGSVIVTNAIVPLDLGALEKFDIRNIAQLKNTVRKSAAQFQEALSKGLLPKELTLDGRVEFTLRNARHEARMLTEEEKDGSRRVILSSDDLLRSARSFRTPLTEPEVALIADYPLRTPRILGIKYRAETIADEEYGNDPDSESANQKDAFRYIVWSYLLTKEYDAAFAKRVTDAHEDGVAGQSRSERRMDIANGALGREYAKRAIPFENLKRTVESDPRVVTTF